jgi:probable F420-dependent oxidoreductase
MAKFKVGVQLHPQATTTDNLRAAWRAADALEVDSIWVWDHFYPLYGDPEAAHFECYALLAAMAVETSHAHIGALVTCNSYRNPNLLADMARTVDHLSGGRFILGIGSGWFERDYTEYGYDFGTAGSRLDDLAEAMPRIEARFAALNPAPTRKIPVLIGGGGEKKTLRLVAKHADIWHSFSRGDDFDRKKQVLAAHCAEVGRDPGEIELSVAANGDPAVNGPVLLEQGVTTFTVGISGPDFDLSAVRAWVDWRDKLGK